jgi:hypothetical protein
MDLPRLPRKNVWLGKGRGRVSKVVQGHRYVQGLDGSTVDTMSLWYQLSAIPWHTFSDQSCMLAPFKSSEVVQAMCSSMPLASILKQGPRKMSILMNACSAWQSCTPLVCYHHHLGYPNSASSQSLLHSGFNFDSRLACYCEIANESVHSTIQL